MNIDIKEVCDSMKRTVVIIAFETAYEGLNGQYDCAAIHGIEENEFNHIKEMAEKLAINVVDSLPSSTRGAALYCVYRQTDDSILTEKEIAQILDEYRNDFQDYEHFEENFYLWELEHAHSF